MSLTASKPASTDPATAAENCPTDLRDIPAWLVWKSEPGSAPGKWQKRPHYATTGHARGNNGTDDDRENLVDFDTALAALRTGQWDGIGLATLPEFGLVIVDFDAKNGRELHPQARTIGDLTYCEFSPGGKGLHAIFRGSMETRKNNPAGVEIFGSTGWVTFTGRATNKNSVAALDDDTRHRLLEMSDSRKKQSPTEYRLRAVGGGDASAHAMSLLGNRESERFNDLRAALSHLNADDRDEWIKNGQRLKSEGDRGFEIWIEWSKTSPKFDPDDAQRVWDSFSGERTSYRAIFSDATRAGWVNPWASPTAETQQERDVGNATRLEIMAAGRVRFDGNTWLVWNEANGGGWLIDEGRGHMTDFAARLRGMIAAEAAQIADTDRRKRALGWAAKCEEKSTIDRALDLLSRRPAIRVKPSELDADPFLIGFDDGRQVIECQGGEYKTRPTCPDDLITKSLGVSHIGQARGAVRWAQFLNEIFCGDAALIGWVQQFFGYCLTGDTSEQFLVFMYGSGSNGKSLLVRILRKAMGSYGVTVAPETLAKARGGKTGSEATEDVARLAGKRAAFSTETHEGAELNEGLIKSLTGGDRITARVLYGHSFEFDPTAKFIIAGNHKPTITGTDDGIWRRIQLVPFNARFSGANSDPDLEEKLIPELPHIVGWLLDGWACYDLCGKGLASRAPECVKAATHDYRDDSDFLSEWLSECCEIGPEYRISVGDAYGSFTHWAERNRVRAISRKRFALTVERPGIKRFRGASNVKMLSGIRLKNIFQKLA